MPPHILVVGGTGMLAELVEALAGDGGRLSLVARHASRSALAGVTGYDADWDDEASFVRALTLAGSIDLAVAWFHDVRLPAARRVAEHVGREGAPGRLFQVLGSAAGDPSRPDRLATAAAVARDLPQCRLRQVVLGFEIEEGRSRWLTHAEICRGVLRAVRSDRSYSVVGRLEPWSARP